MKKIQKNEELTRQQKEIYKARYTLSLFGAYGDFETEAVYQKRIDKELEKAVLSNIFYQNLLYGKQDYDKNVVVPNPSFISAMNFVEGQNYAFSFVVDAYKQLSDNWKRLLVQGRITEQQKMSLNPRTSYTSFENAYRKEIYNFYRGFLDYVEYNKLYKEITDLKSFIRQYSKYIPLYVIENPVLISDFVKSKRCPHTASGMTIQLDKDFNSHRDKHVFIESSSFEKFAELCYLHGFIIEKNNPSMLFFNIENENSHKYIQKYLNNNENIKRDFYNKFFVKTKNYDLYFLKKYILMFYRFLVASRPTIERITHSYCNEKLVTKSEIIKRQTVDQDQYIEMLDNDNSIVWWRLFIFIKFTKLEINISQDYFEKIVTETYRLSKKLDEFEALEYLERKAGLLPRSAGKEANFSY